MVTLLFTSILILGIIAVGLYFWQKPASRRELEEDLPHSSFPLREPRQLFSNSADVEENQKTLAPSASADELLKRAASDDKSALDEASTIADQNVYDRVLSVFLDKEKSDSELLSLVSHVVRNGLKVNRQLASAIIQSWKNSPDRPSTAKMLHIAALSDDVATYQSAVEEALRFWRHNRISQMTAIELRSLFDGEFWVLSSGSRNSGAGFILKRTLANARRELEAAARVSQ